MHISHGTIPWLGTFLTDLQMIHTAIPDTMGTTNLINFDKKRKEFELLAQIKLLQGAANAYDLREDLQFDRWFASLLVLDEREGHALSCQLEPQLVENKRIQSGHKKTDSITSNSSSGAGSQFYCEIGAGNGVVHSGDSNSLDRNATPPNASVMSATSSVSSLSMDSSSSGKNQMNASTPKTHHNSSNASSVNTHNSKGNHHLITNPQPNSPHKNPSPDFYIIRVTYETENIELDGIVLYKSIMLGNNERTPNVIKNAMMKLSLEGDPDRWTLAQVLPDKELVMPPNANVYYAVNTAFNLNFILRPKRDAP